MKFKHIKFSNYRCFIDGTIDFTLSQKADGKNIILFSAENGGGKTQLMFAFRFALYGLTKDEFIKIPGQDSHPYALNDNLYMALERGEGETSATASVELAFQFNNKTYTIIRSHTYHRVRRGVDNKPVEDVKLFIQELHGDTKVISSPEEVRLHVSKIIPEKTLYALLCDGERVRQLSSTGTETDNAVQAVIQRMGKRDILIATKNAIKAVNGRIQTLMRRNATNATLLEEALQKKVIAERTIETAELKVVELERKSEAIKKRLEEISIDLQEIAIVREKEARRRDYYDQIKKHEDELEELQKELIVVLNGTAYWGIATTLCARVHGLLKDVAIDFPGLQSNVVKNIMQKERCICGRCIDDTIRRILKDLSEKLPPVKIDAELRETLFRYGDDDKLQSLKKNVANPLAQMANLERQIADLNKLITQISEEIEATSNVKAAELEAENRSLKEEEKECTEQKTLYKEKIRTSNEALREANATIVEEGTKGENGGKLKRQLSLLSAADKGVEFIKIKLEQDSIRTINKHLHNSFAQLRSTSDSERQVYITMFQDMYRLIAYHYPSVEKDFKSKASANMSTEEREQLREKMIIRHEVASSMGQLKMNSLAFMKAVLDYVKENAVKYRGMEDVSYPFIADAPFSDIERENLANATAYLHEFSEQVILLSAQEEIPAGIKPYIAKIYEVRRTTKKGLSYPVSEIVQRV